MKAGDIVVTQQYRSGFDIITKGSLRLSPKGISYEEKSIHTALDMRYLSAKARRKEVYGKGPKPYTHEGR